MSTLRLLQREIPGVEAAVGDIVDVAAWRAPNLATLERLRYVAPVPADHPALVGAAGTPQGASAAPAKRPARAPKE